MIRPKNVTKRKKNLNFPVKRRKTKILTFFFAETSAHNSSAAAVCLCFDKIPDLYLQTAG